MFQEHEVKVKMKMDELKDKITDKSHEILNRWEEKSRDLITSFIDMFGQEGRLVSLMRSFSRTHLFPDDVTNDSCSAAASGVEQSNGQGRSDRSQDGDDGNNKCDKNHNQK